MDNETNFRIAENQDLKSIVNIYNQSIPGHMATADTEPVSVESKRKWFKQYTPDHFPMWVIEFNHQFAGWVGLSEFYGRPAYH
ncbi:hypothetical protein WR164_14620 [Philodulcilactobacillus myokoensis]|uniref:Uncharacterized protein n=1 Tax=Philodulcilactobacillus myokoensis TaxID=2929573 RepID=A0A9W6ETW8_9LACO|nr:hypothetical protein [Philodulcilactobacillus myokoensis]GLB47483.1 hypothetical protein WR164_14620 [Philodulcilactobacillus myokoensis]